MDFGYQEHVDHEFGARYDDVRERFGDPCPIHGTLRGGGDCWQCLDEIADVEALQNTLDLVADTPGSLAVTRKQRKDAILYLKFRGWKNVRAVGAKVVWS